MMEDEDIPVLSANTLSALQEFYDERAAHQEKFDRIQAQVDVESSDAILDMNLFAENWQDSQFWYTTETARTLATALLADSAEGETVAMVSAPSVYVAARILLKERGKPENEWPRLLLLEFDRRFDVFKDDFIFFDFRKPLSLPLDLKGTVDHIICDPPFLSEDCQIKTAMTVQWLSKSWPIRSELRGRESRLIVCTGERMEEIIAKLYREKGVVTTNFIPIHTGQQLSNEFLCYANFECSQWTWRTKM